MTNWPTHHPW